VKPRTNQPCEICKKESYNIIIDAQLNESGPLGNRGLWLFMCPSCHKIHGQGFKEDRCTIYVRVNGRYFEQKGIYLMTIDEIQQTIDRFSTLVKNDKDQAAVVLQGEIALQLAIWNRNMEENNNLLRRVLHPLIVVRGGSDVDGTSDEV